MKLNEIVIRYSTIRAYLIFESKLREICKFVMPDSHYFGDRTQFPLILGKCDFGQFPVWFPSENLLIHLKLCDPYIQILNTIFVDVEILLLS